jgi:hypothetical protein
MSEIAKSTFENINDLIKATAWPLIVIIIFIFYRKELGSIIKLIPNKIEKSSKITVGSLSFEIEKSAKIAGDEQLGIIIKNLSEKGIRKLLTLGSGRHSIMVRSEKLKNDIQEKAFTTPIDLDVLKELEKNGLIKIDESIDDFVAFFKKLKPIEEVKFKSADGSYRDTEDDNHKEKFMQLSISELSLTEEQRKKIDKYGLELSENGRKAFEIIVHVIAEQINKEN